MSRRIALFIAVAAGTAFVAPAAADRECFDNTCRMPEVIEAPEAPPAAVEEPAVEAASAAAPGAPASGPTRPQMAVDALPKPPIEPLAKRPAETGARQAAAQTPRYYETADEPVDVAGRRQYAAAESTPTYSPHQAQPYPGAGIVVVVPGVQYGADGVALEQSRQDSSWQLCQTDRGERGRCTPYNYQPFGPYGYRPMGSYRSHQPAPSYVYVPGAKVITIEDVSTGAK